MISSQRNLGILSILLGAAIWGVFWIPLRYLDENGISGLWSIAMVTGCSFLPTFVIAIWRKEFTQRDAGGIFTIGCGIGLALTLYFIGVILSDVIRVVFLFYLLPIWTALIAKFFLGEKLGPLRSLCILAALVGVWLLLGDGAGLPVPKNIGDWCGLASGLVWAICLTVIRKKNEVGVFASISTTFLFSFAFSALVAFAFGSGSNAGDLELDSEKLIQLLLIASLFGVIVLLPAMFGQVWGARYVEAPLAALLTMSEIILATLSAWHLIGTSLSTLSIIGGMIIISAVAVDLFYQYRTNKA